MRKQYSVLCVFLVNSSWSNTAYYTEICGYTIYFSLYVSLQIYNIHFSTNIAVTVYSSGMCMVEMMTCEYSCSEGQDMDHIHKYPSQYSDFLIGT